MDTRLQTGFHDGQVLVGQCHIDDHFRLELLDELYEGGYVFGVNPCGLDALVAGGSLGRCGDGVAFFLRAARQHDFAENFGVLCAFVNHDPAHAARTND